MNDGSGFDVCQISFRHQSRETSLIRAAHNLAHSPGPLHVPVVFGFKIRPLSSPGQGFVGAFCSSHAHVVGNRRCR